MTNPLRHPARILSRAEGQRRCLVAMGEPDADLAMRRDIAVHDAVRLLELEPATSTESGYDARGPDHRYRITGCTPADPLLPPGAFRPGNWDRGLLVSMTAEMEPLTIDELTLEAARATRLVAELRASGHRVWRRA